jgi:hypothetical protein
MARTRRRGAVFTAPPAASQARRGALDRASPNVMGLASLRLDIGVFCDFLSSFLLFGAFSGLDFLGRALSRPQVGRRTTTGRTARCAAGCEVIKRRSQFNRAEEQL